MTPPSYGPLYGAAPEPTPPPVPPRRGRRVLVLPAVAAALALGIGGISAGYALARQQQPSAGASSTPQNSPVMLAPGYGDGQDPGVQQLPTDPYGYDGSGGTHR